MMKLTMMIIVLVMSMMMMMMVMMMMIMTSYRFRGVLGANSSKSDDFVAI